MKSNIGRESQALAQTQQSIHYQQFEKKSKSINTNNIDEVDLRSGLYQIEQISKYQDSMPRELIN